LNPVGIIANPASGKDIRRLVAYGSVFDNNEKVNIVRRILLGLEAMSVREVHCMPDFFGICVRALDGLEVGFKTVFLEMDMEGVQEDSTQAAARMNAQGIGCIVTLGGDGTNRAVAKACGDTPILPISTGTNNVFPFMVESTLAGIAAGFVAMDTPDNELCVKRAPRLEIRKDGVLVDIALVDAVVSKAGFIATRALWDVDAVKEIFLARAEPDNIGFSSIGGLLYGMAPDSGKGVHIVLGNGHGRVRAPIAPGLIRSIPIQSHDLFGPGEEIPLTHAPAVIALDGERELMVKQGDAWTLRLNVSGPRVVNIALALSLASRQGLFREP